VFTNVQDVYKTAGEDWKKSLTKFNQSLQDSNLLIGIGGTSLWIVHLRTNKWVDTNTVVQKIAQREDGIFTYLGYVANNYKIKSMMSLNGCSLGASVTDMKLSDPCAHQSPEAGFGTRRKSKIGLMAHRRIYSFVREFVSCLP
jgi:hypothetical protein